MKILMAVHNYPPEFVGGVERSVMALAQALKASGHELRIVSGFEKRLDHASIVDEEHEGILVHRIHRARGYNNAIDLHDPLVDAAVENVLAGFAPDVFHVHHWFGLSTGLIALAARLGIPSVVSLHDYWTTCALFFRLPDPGRFCEEIESLETCTACLVNRRPMEGGEMRFSLEMRFAELDQELRLAAAIIVSGEKQLRNLARLGRFPRSVFEKVRLEPLGVVDAATSLHEPRDRSSGRLVVAHWGNLSPVKGVLDLIDALRASTAAQSFKLKLIGAAVDEAFAAEIANRLDGLEVERHGSYDARGLDKHLADVDVAVFPSQAMETHSIVVDEALVRKIPVVVSDRGAMADRVQGRGLVVPAGDVGALRQALEDLLALDLRRELASGTGQPVVTAAAFAAAMVETYREVVARPKPARGRDIGRDRLAFRNHRLAEIAHFVGLTLQKNKILEGLVRTSPEILEELKSLDKTLHDQIVEGDASAPRE